MDSVPGNTPGPVLVLPHGGGSLPLLDDPGNAQLVRILDDIDTMLGRPSAILVISAHRVAEVPTLTGGERPALI